MRPARSRDALEEQADLFNLLCIPPVAFGTDVAQVTWDAAVAYAKRRRAMVIVDAPENWLRPSDAVAGIGALVTRDENGAIYFPRIRVPDPLRENRLTTFASSGAVAGSNTPFGCKQPQPVCEMP